MTEKRIESVDADTLLSTPFAPTPFVVDGLIPHGASILSGDSKIGKSWLMLWLGLQVAEGKPVWDFPTHACDVLYLCLEDNYRRIQQRLFRLTDSAPTNLRFGISIDNIENGLEEQVNNYLAEYPKTKFIIIDTLQKVRDSKSNTGKNSMYAGDYDDISAIKTIADKNDIAIVLVHHARKQKDDKDPFNDATGSTGLNGAADSMFILKKDNRAANTARLFATGRDIADQELVLTRENCIWQLTEKKDSDTIRQEAIPDFVHRLVVFMSERNEWTGSATDLAREMNEHEVAACAVTKYISKYCYEALRPAGISFKSKRTGKSRILMLKRSDGCDGNDGFSCTG